MRRSRPLSLPPPGGTGRGAGLRDAAAKAAEKQAAADVEEAILVPPVEEEIVDETPIVEADDPAPPAEESPADEPAPAAVVEPVEVPVTASPPGKPRSFPQWTPVTFRLHDGC